MGELLPSAPLVPMPGGSDALHMLEVRAPQSAPVQPSGQVEPGSCRPIPMARRGTWRDRVSRWDARATHWGGRGGPIIPSRQDVAEMLAPLVERIEALEREVEQLRKR